MSKNAYAIGVYADRSLGPGGHAKKQKKGRDSLWGTGLSKKHTIPKDAAKVLEALAAGCYLKERDQISSLWFNLYAANGNKLEADYSRPVIAYMRKQQWADLEAKTFRIVITEKGREEWLRQNQLKAGYGADK